MAHSIKRTKAAKPRPDFPLYVHAQGYWAKRVLGKVRYFGKVCDDPKGQAALALWLERKDDLLAGREPRTPEGRRTLLELCNAFMEAKERARDAGELSPRTYRDYHAACRELLATFGKTRSVDDLRPDDFAKLRAKWAKRLGAQALARQVQQARTLFKFGYDAGLLDVPVRTGPEFRQPSKKAKRAAKNAAGPKMFEAGELRAILAEAKQPMRSMILLGLNCAFGNADCGALPQAAIDFERGWLNFARCKTGIPRRIPLWVETMESLREAIARRPTPNDAGDDGLCFITRPGNRWASNKDSDSPISKAFRKLLDKLDLHRPGLGFYALRHVAATIGAEAKDPAAVAAILGHVDGSMTGHYIERISDERLQAVTDHVHAWLFGAEEGGAK